MIRSFLETALMPDFKRNFYHEALFCWYVEDKRDIPCPALPPYYDINFFALIKQVKQDGLLNIKTMTSGLWYRVLVEDNVTHQLSNSSRVLVPCRIETKHPEVDWVRAWSLACTPGLSSMHLTFLWRMTHDLLPTQARLFRMKMPNAASAICSLCNQNMVGDLTHSLLICSFNDGAGQFLLSKIKHLVANPLPQQVVLLDLDVDEDHQLPLVFLIASVLSQVWESRKEKKPCNLSTIRATLEAGINILRKSRHNQASQKLLLLLADN